METILKVLKDIKNKPKYTRLIFTPKIPYLEQDMENQRVKSIVIPMLPVIEKEIDDQIFIKIKSCENVAESLVCFEDLQNIHAVLCRMVYGEDVDVSNKLRGFMKDFDRLDDPWLIEQLFKQIKHGSYNYDFL